MFQRLISLACCLVIAVFEPSFASPQADTDYIVGRFVTDDTSQNDLRKIVVKAQARKLSYALLTHSVKIKDHDKFMALLPKDFGDFDADRVHKVASDHFVHNFDPKQLEAVANYIRNNPHAAFAIRREESKGTEEKLPTIEELTQNFDALVEDETFKTELAVMVVGATLIGLMVQESERIEIDLKAPYVADMLEVEGVFYFSNRIARKNLIHELRSANP